MNNFTQPFINTIYHMRTIEQVILYNKLTEISKSEENEVIDFLESEYEKESVDYPLGKPQFNKEAALWGAKIVYFAAQLFLYRENTKSQLTNLVPVFTEQINPSCLLSADLCLRFLPTIVKEMSFIDSEDVLVDILEKHLQIFHYSAIGFDLELGEINTNLILENKCLEQLYVDRIIERKAVKFINYPILKSLVFASLGDYKNEFCKELSI